MFFYYLYGVVNTVQCLFYVTVSTSPCLQIQVPEFFTLHTSAINLQGYTRVLNRIISSLIELFSFNDVTLDQIKCNLIALSIANVWYVFERNSAECKM